MNRVESIGFARSARYAVDVRPHVPYDGDCGNSRLRALVRGHHVDIRPVHGFRIPETRHGAVIFPAESVTTHQG